MNILKPCLALLALLIGQSLWAQDIQTDLKNIRDQAQREIVESAGTVYTVVFDNSGSMEGDRIANAKRAFQWWLLSVPEGSTWAVYNFYEGGRCVLPFTLNGQKKAAEVINSFEAKTNTPICATLARAFRDISVRRNGKPFERHVILLFTDGEENQDSRGNSGVQQDLRAIRSHGIEVVAIGYAGAGDYIDGYASRFFRANDQRALQTGLAQVQSEIDVNAPIDITPEEMERLSKFAVPPTSAPRQQPANFRPSTSVDNNSDPLAAIQGNALKIGGWVLGAVLLVIILKTMFSRD